MDQLRQFARWLFALPDAGIPSGPVDPLEGIDQLLVRNDRRLVSALLVFLLGPLFWFLGLDLAVFANDWPRLRERLLVRGISILVPVAALLVVRTAQSRKAYSRAVLAVAISVPVLHLSTNLLRPQGSMLPLRSPLMFLVIMYGALPNSYCRQIVPALVYTAGLIAERALWFTSNARGDLSMDVTVLLFVNAVGVFMVYRRVTLEREIGIRFRAEQRSVLAARQAIADLRALRGIIPICSHCGQVRSEVGDWQQLEQYLAEHTEADFSHGVCPDCIREHYSGSGRPER